VSEYDIEPVPGLPQRPPAGEQILWQGSPRWQTLAIRVFHARKVAIYFAVIILWRLVSAVSEGDGVLAAATSALWLPPIALTAVGVLVALAWQTGRTTIYTITNRRVAMRFGIALPMTVNIPFRIIGAAALKTSAGGTGDIPLSLSGPDRIAYLVLWPHVRPWHVARPQPMLRAVPDALRVAETLSRAIILAAEPVESEADATEGATPRTSRPLVTAAA
jgi:hypothetical protein